MKFDDYKNMKNFSEQQNFAAPAWLQKFINPEAMAAVKAKGASAWDALKAVPGKVKGAANKAWNPGAGDLKLAQVHNDAVRNIEKAWDKASDIRAINLRKQGITPTYANSMYQGTPGKMADAFGEQARLAERAELKGNLKNLGARTGIIATPLAAIAGAAKLHGDKTLKGAEGVFQKIGSKFTEGKGFFGSTRAAQQAKLGKMIAGGAGVGALGTGATIYALAGSGAVDPAKYYIFDGESGKPLSDGFATKDEALAVRNQNFPGARINRGNTLMQKAG